MCSAQDKTNQTPFMVEIDLRNPLGYAQICLYVYIFDYYQVKHVIAVSREKK
jgi:hypothetical protein